MDSPWLSLDYSVYALLVFTGLNLAIIIASLRRGNQVSSLLKDRRHALQEAQRGFNPSWLEIPAAGLPFIAAWYLGLRGLPPWVVLLAGVLLFGATACLAWRRMDRHYTVAGITREERRPLERLERTLMVLQCLALAVITSVLWAMSQKMP